MHINAAHGQLDPVKTPRLALTKREAAEALGMSVDSFERHVQPELRVVRRGRLRLFALTEIERWLRENGAKTIEVS
jgi:excisionase family DNA binding protein